MHALVRVLRAPLKFQADSNAGKKDVKINRSGSPIEIWIWIWIDTPGPIQIQIQKFE